MATVFETRLIGNIGKDAVVKMVKPKPKRLG
jgi:hypothetical protein